jgi:hypothetical protein
MLLEHLVNENVCNKKRKKRENIECPVEKRIKGAQSKKLSAVQLYFKLTTIITV